jgi:uncharacterized phage infection (PIP) family protein YhgE
MNTFFHVLTLGALGYIIYQIIGVKKKMGNDETTLDAGITELKGNLKAIGEGVTTLQNNNKTIQDKLDELLGDNPDLSDEIAEITELNAESKTILDGMPKPTVPETGGGDVTQGGHEGDAVDTGNVSGGAETQEGADVSGAENTETGDATQAGEETAEPVNEET